MICFNNNATAVYLMHSGFAVLSERSGRNNFICKSFGCSCIHLIFPLLYVIIENNGNKKCKGSFSGSGLIAKFAADNAHKIRSAYRGNP